MEAYSLVKSGDSCRLIPSNTGSTPEFAMENYAMCLLDHLVDDGTGGYVHRYRLHSRNAMRFEDTLDYDITCPRCNKTALRLCGKQLDWYDHGLYKCPICDKH